MLEARNLSAVEDDVRRSPDQSSSLSWRYFLMLAGREDLVKPERTIFRSLKRVVGRPVGPEEAQAMLTDVTRELDREFPGIKPRTPDNLIWRQERERQIDGHAPRPHGRAAAAHERLLLFVHADYEVRIYIIELGVIRGESLALDPVSGASVLW